MAKGCELSYVTDRANCSTEMKEKKRRRSWEDKASYGKSEKGG